MKKIILFSLLLSSLAFADAKIYVGTGYAYTTTVVNLPNSPQEKTISANSARVKVGYGQRDAYAIEFSLDYIDSDPKIYAFDISLVKAFDWDIIINPFVKVGFGAGILDNRGSSQKSLSYGSFNFGTGFFYPINETLDIELAYEYKNRSYEKVDRTDSTESRTSHVNLGYIGVNVRF